MTAQTEQFVAANKAAVDSLLAVANTALASAERIAVLNLNTVRAVLEDSVSGAKAVAEAKNPQEAAALQANLTQPTIEKAVAYSRSVMEITTQTQQEFAKMAQDQFGEFQKSVASLMEQTTKMAPAGFEESFAAVRNAFTSGNTAFGNMSTFAKQFADVAQANVATMTAAAAGKKSK